MSDLKQRLIRSYVQRDAVQFDVILEELFAVHPPLAELAERIANWYIEPAALPDPEHGIGAREIYRHSTNQRAKERKILANGITAHLAPLYAELERLKAENARLLNDLAMLLQTDLLQDALIRKDALLRECRGYVNEAVASAEYFAREAEYESHASESRAEASVHRGLLARIDQETGGGDG